MKAETIAKVCHEVIKAFCEANGDFSQKPWEETEEWQKQSAIRGVEFALVSNTTPAMQHDAWMKEKAENGWIYGEIKDPEKKTHPSIVPYEQLPPYQKIKDHLFLAVVNSLKEV